MARLRSKKLLVVPDTHVPFHDMLAWKGLCAFSRKFQPDTVVVLGDFLDLDMMSSFSFPAYRAGKLPQDLMEARSLLRMLQKSSGVRKIHFLEGNHEHRAAKKLASVIPEMSPLVSLEKLMKENVSEDLVYYPYRGKLRVNEVICTHDFKRHGKMAIRQTLEKFQTSFVQGHLHKSQTETLTKLDGTVVRGHCAGWLGDSSQVGYKELWDAEMDYHTGFMYGEYDLTRRFELRHAQP